MYCNGNRNSRVFGSFSKPTWWSCRRCLRMKAARRCASLGLWISFGAMSYQDLRFPSSVVGFWQSLASGGTRVVVARQNWAGLVPDFPQFQNWWIDRVWKGLIGSIIPPSPASVNQPMQPMAAWHSPGYDPSMRSWGGENIDQSLRTWLCGGEIVYAEGSRVAFHACTWSPHIPNRMPHIERHRACWIPQPIPSTPHLWSRSYESRVTLILIFNDLHWSSLIFIDLHWSSMIYIDLHWSSMIYIDLHWLHWYTLIFIDLHWTSLI
jgi:hypothetical protein